MAEPSSMEEKPSFRKILASVPFALRFIYEADRKSFVGLVANELLQFPLAIGSVLALKFLIDALTALNAPAAWQGFGWLALVAFGQMLYGYVRDRVNDVLRYRVEIAANKKWAERMSTVPFATLEDPAFQTLAHAFDRKSYVLQNVTMALVWVLRGSMETLGLASVFFFLPWQAVVLFVCAQILRVWLLRGASEWSWELLGLETREGRRAAYYRSALTNNLSVFAAKAFGFAKPFLLRWEKLAGAILRKKLDIVRRTARANVYANIVESLGFGLMLFLVVEGVLTRTMSASIAILFIATYQRVQGALVQVSGNFFWLLHESASLPLFRDFFSVEPESDRGVPLSPRPLRVAFEDVWFRYPGSTQDILRGISLAFDQGDHLALVGLNGSGKSTLLKLLMGIYQPTKGRVTVNGIPLEKIKPSSWRRALAVMSQEIPRFDDVLIEQIHYGDLSQDMDRRRLKRAVTVSGFQGMAEEFPKKMKTHIGKQYAMPEDEAIELSGGQNQILAIARTLYRDAKLYIFDEPTSAVDAEKEERFFEALPDALPHQAVMYVSHRFSVLRRAERIIVIDQGRVIEDGTHEELMAKEGRYAELFTLQAKMYQ